MLNDTVNVELLDDTPVASTKSISGDTHSGQNIISGGDGGEKLSKKKFEEARKKASVAKSLV